MTETKPIEILLSILIAISSGFALEKLASIEGSGKWLWLSTLTIIVSVAFIYFLLDIHFKKERWINEALKVGLLISVIFFPFTLYRLDKEATSSSTGFAWGLGSEMIYGIIAGLLFIFWGVSEYYLERTEENKNQKLVKTVSGIIVGILIIISAITIKVLLKE